MEHITVTNSESFKKTQLLATALMSFDGVDTEC